MTKNSILQNKTRLIFDDCNEDSVLIQIQKDSLIAGTRHNYSKQSLVSNESLKEGRYTVSPALAVAHAQPYLNFEQTSFAVDNERQKDEASEYLIDDLAPESMKNHKGDLSTIDISREYAL